MELLVGFIDFHIEYRWIRCNNKNVTAIIFFLITLIESNVLKINKKYISLNNLRLNKRINYYIVKANNFKNV